jgi:peptide/nickel transport system permease protein
MSQEANIEAIAPRSEPMERATPGSSVRLDQFGRSQRKQRSLWGNAWRQFRRHKLAMAGLVVFVFFILATFVGTLVYPYEIDDIDFSLASGTLTWSHPFGTDSLGQDILARILWGGRVSIAVGLCAAAVAILLGTTVGSVAGFFGGLIETLIMRITDIFMAFPLFLLLIVLVSVLGPSATNVVLILGLFSWMVVARLVRGQVLSVMTAPYIEAAIAAGAQGHRIVLRQVLPNAFVPVIVASTLGVANAMLSEAALSFLGLGIQPPTPSWGNMLNAAQSLQVLVNEPWVWIGPGAAIALTVLSINFLGDGLRDAADPYAQEGR